MSPDSQATRAPSVPVVLVSMPFGPLQNPSIGLSLLKAVLREAGIPSQVLYFQLAYAKQITAKLYHPLANSYPGVADLAGEWLFSHALFENKPDDFHAYVTTILRRKRQEYDIPWDDLEGFIAGLMLARMGVSSFVDACVEALIDTGAKVVGFTSVFQQNVATLAVAQRLKRRRPDIITVFGGANFEGPPGREQFARFPFLDVVFSGEAEQRFPPVIQRLLRGERLGPLPGMLAREHLAGGAPFPSGIDVMLRDMDSLPHPDFSDYFAQWEEAQLETDQRPELLFETSRGCWWGQKQHCTFCGLNGETMTYRSKSPQRALSEFTALTEAYPGKPVTVVDNILELKYFKSFLPELAARGNPVELFYEIKANLTREQVRLLKDARVLKIQPGVESLSDQVLRLMRKGITGIQNLQLLKWCKELGIMPIWNILWGFPGEEPAEYARMAEALPLLTHLTPPLQGTAIFLERFSPNYSEAKARGLKNVRAAPAYSFVYNLPEEALQNIAYYFTHEYEDGRDVTSYTKPVADRIADWKAEHATSTLYFRDEGDRLLVFDNRKIAPSPVVSLRGAERWAVLACDGVMSLNALKTAWRQQEPEARGWDALESVLARLVEAKLLFTDGKSYLGLPLPMPEHAAASVGAAEMGAAH